MGEILIALPIPAQLLGKKKGRVVNPFIVKLAVLFSKGERFKDVINLGFRGCFHFVWVGLISNGFTVGRASSAFRPSENNAQAFSPKGEHTLKLLFVAIEQYLSLFPIQPSIPSRNQSRIGSLAKVGFSSHLRVLLLVQHHTAA
jgi:hypothetical protein